jgi:hypothetical protein
MLFWYKEGIRKPEVKCFWQSDIFGPGPIGLYQRYVLPCWAYLCTLKLRQCIPQKPWRLTATLHMLNTYKKTAIFVDLKSDLDQEAWPQWLRCPWFSSVCHNECQNMLPTSKFSTSIHNYIPIAILQHHVALCRSCFSVSLYCKMAWLAFFRYTSWSCVKSTHSSSSCPVRLICTFKDGHLGWNM